MKYVVVVPDGVSDVPLKELGNKTPLEVAQHPNMDRVAREGVTGWARTIPTGFPPGSDVGCMSVFGYNPRRHHTGRAPLEAAAQGIVLRPDEVAFRCNTVTVTDGILADYSAGHIESADAAELIRSVDEALGKNGVRFYPGVSYRHLMVIAGAEHAKTRCTPPHDISGKPTAPHAPQGPGASRLGELLCKAAGILKDHPVNRRRVEAGKPPANELWFWGQGTATTLPPFKQAYGLRGSCISAVDIVRGIARLAGLEVLQVPGITGYFDTNYEGKAEHALKALDAGCDFVLVHIESTDEAGHMGDAQKKVQAIEDVDRLVVGPLLEGLKRRQPFAMLITPDHSTSTALRTHIVGPVPFALYATNGPTDRVAAYHETAVQGSAKRFDEGFQLMTFFLQQGKQ